MDYLTWLLTFAVIGYAAALTVQTGKPLLHYRKAKERVTKITGEITSFYGKEVTKRRGEVITSFYPVYSCEIAGETRTLNGLVRYIGETQKTVGQTAELLYDRETEELWCEKDLPLMAKQIKVRLVTSAVLLILMIVTSVTL